MAYIWRILFIILAAYLFLSIYLYIRQPSMVYFPKKELIGTPTDIALPYREIFFDSRDGVRLCGWFIGKEDQKDQPLILFFHGNGGNISHRLESISIFNRLNLNVFIIDYRGYGKSKGKPSEKGTALDARAAWDYVVNHEKIPPEKIIIFGRSLGGAVAAQLAASQGIEARALILESTFTSIPDIGAEIYPFLPVRTLSRFQYATIDRIKSIHLPVLIIHSPQDQLIPYKHGRRLYSAANKPKHFLKISGSHDEGFVNAIEVYMEGLNAFFSSLP
jgi:pimeloyl-ACP methyl ester carboxylesterase